jgi:hypothetical protein
MIYSFNLSNFEAGAFTSTRYPENCAVSGDYVIVAADDADALAQARQSAYDEWMAPDTREYHEFTVEFVDSLALRNLELGVSVAEALKGLKVVPKDHFFQVVGHSAPKESLQGMLDALKNAGMVQEENQILTWVER